MAVTFDAVTAAAFNASTYNHTTHTVAVGSNGILMVLAGTGGNDTQESGITWNSVALTKLSDVPNNASLDLWYLLNPTAGNQTLALTLGASQRTAIVVASYFGVDQGTPLGTAATNTGSSGTSSVVVTSATGELVFGGVAVEQKPTVTSDGSQTERGNQGTAGTTVDDATTVGAEKAGAASVTIQWTHASQAWAAAGVSLKPASLGVRNLLLLGVG